MVGFVSRGQLTVYISVHEGVKGASRTPSRRIRHGQTEVFMQDPDFNSVLTTFPLPSPSCAQFVAELQGGCVRGILADVYDSQ